MFANEIKYTIRSIGVRMFVGHTTVYYYYYFINKYLDNNISPSARFWLYDKWLTIIDVATYYSYELRFQIYFGL